jgi:hypothetical protein
LHEQCVLFQKKNVCGWAASRNYTDMRYDLCLTNRMASSQLVSRMRLATWLGNLESCMHTARLGSARVRTYFFPSYDQHLFAKKKNDAQHSGRNLGNAAATAASERLTDLASAPTPQHCRLIMEDDQLCEEVRVPDLG